MITWTGKETNGKTIGTVSAEDMHDLLYKLSDNTRIKHVVGDYFDRDLTVEFLSKENSEIAELNKKIEEADAEADYDKVDKLFEEQTDKIYEEINKLSESKVEELIKFAGAAFRDEFTTADDEE